MKGEVRVKRFKSNIDFDIDVDVRTETEPARTIKGNFQMNHPARDAHEKGGARAAAAPKGEDGAAHKKHGAAPAALVTATLTAVRQYAEGMRDGDEKKLRAVIHPDGKEAQTRPL